MHRSHGARATVTDRTPLLDEHKEGSISGCCPGWSRHHQSQAGPLGHRHGALGTAAFRASPPDTSCKFQFTDTKETSFRVASY